MLNGKGNEATSQTRTKSYKYRYREYEEGWNKIEEKPHKCERNNVQWGIPYSHFSIFLSIVFLLLHESITYFNTFKY